MAMAEASISNPVLFAKDPINNAQIKEMVNAIEKFRGLGVAEYLALPQIVVIGDQSAGKSSLLQNLTGCPFPTGSELCTRFPIEVKLSYAEQLSFRTSIVPAPNALPEQRDRLKDYPTTYHEGEFSKSDFVKEFNKASEFLGLPIPEDSTDQTSEDVEAPMGFSKDMLRIEVNGPQHSLLSFIDTPGLFQSGSTRNNARDKQKVEKLVKELIGKKRTIIVVAADATDNVETQSSLSLIPAGDKAWSRTLGVLTKCDAASYEVDVCDMAMRIARNKRFPLQLGWYVTKNKLKKYRLQSKDKSDDTFSLDSLREEENELFQQAPWNQLNPARCGSSQLRTALGELFTKHVRQEFPKIMEDLEKKVLEARETLESLGPPRSTSEEQRHYLLEICSRYEKLMRECLSGNQTGLEKDMPALQYQKTVAKEKFKKSMTRGGLRFKFLNETEKYDKRNIDLASRKLEVFQTGPHMNQNENIYGWINRRCHQNSIPSACGLVSQDFVDKLHGELIGPWREHANTILEELFESLKELIKYVVDAASNNSSISSALIQHLSFIARDEIDGAQSQADELFERESKLVETSHEQFLSELLTKRTWRLQQALRMHLASVNSMSSGQVDMSQTTVDQMFTRIRTEQLQDVLQQPRDAVFEIHDILESYVKYSGRRYTDNIISIVEELTAPDTSPLSFFNSLHVEALTKEQLESICGEDDDTSSLRHNLEIEIDRLEEARAHAQRIGANSRMPDPGADRPASQSSVKGVGARSPFVSSTVPSPSSQGGLRNQPATEHKPKEEEFYNSFEDLSLDESARAQGSETSNLALPADQALYTRQPSPRRKAPMTPERPGIAVHVQTPPPSDERGSAQNFVMNTRPATSTMSSSGRMFGGSPQPVRPTPYRWPSNTIDELEDSDL